MAISQATLETAILNWLSNQEDYTTKQLSAEAFADMYYNWAKDATADDKPMDLGSADKTLISNLIIALPDENDDGELFAEAVDQGLVLFWTNITFDSGDTTVSDGTPPVFGPVKNALVASFEDNLETSSTKEIIAAEIAQILYSMIGTIEAQYGDEPNTTKVPII